MYTLSCTPKLEHVRKEKCSEFRYWKNIFVNTNAGGREFIVFDDTNDDMEIPLST